MKWFKFAFIAAVVALALSVGTAEASRMFLSTTSTSPALINPTLTMSVGSTAALYLFWEPTTEQVGTDPYSGDPIIQNEQLSGWSHDIDASNGLLGRTSYAILNPTAAGSPRWGAISTGGGAATFMVDDANAVKVGGSNLGFFTSSGQGYFNVAGNDVWRLSTLTFQCLGVGSTTIKLGVGASGISFETTPNARGINFGFLDGQVQSNSFGSTSTIADATVINVPEPGTLALLGMGAVGLVAVVRRRRRST